MSKDAHAAAPSVVRRLWPEEWPAFRDLRLDALRSDPLAFGSTVSRESSYDEPKWRDWCRRGAAGENEATFVASPTDGRLLGMVGSFSAAGTAHVWGMWVRPDSRRRGLARQLMDELLEWIRRNAPHAPVVLEVNPELEAAVRLYLALGFRFTGEERPLGHDPPAVVRTMTLVRPPAP